MLAVYDLRLVLAAMAASTLAMVQYVGHADDPTFYLLPIVTFALVFALPQLARLEGFTLISWLMAAMVLFDEPHNFAYNEWDPWTKILGPLLYERLGELGVPGLIITPLEILTVSLAIWLMFSGGRREHYALLSSPRFRLVTALALVLPAAGAFAMLRGQLTGGDLRLAFTQFRYIPYFGLWLYIGYIGYRSPTQLPLLFKLILGATMIKCLQGWYVFFVVFDMKMGKREYLIEHITSEHIAICMLLVSYLWWHYRRHIWHTVLALAGVVTLILPYFLNLRRASFLGLGITLALLPIVYYKNIRRWHLLGAFGLGSAAALVLTLLWNTTSPLGILVYPLKRFFIKDKYFSLDYRDVENFNQYHEAMESPFTGWGFGHHMKMFMPLTDISNFYPLYDVLPHNNVLFLWANGGPLAAAAIAAICVVSLAVALRLNRIAKDAWTKILAFLAWGMVIRWLVYAYTDVGLFKFRLPALLGLVVGVSIHSLALLQRRGEPEYVPK